MVSTGTNAAVRRWTTGALLAVGTTLLGLTAGAVPTGAATPVQVATTLQATYSTTSVVYPAKPLVTGTLSRTDGVAGGMEHQWVMLQHYVGGAWGDDYGHFTNSSGQVRFHPPTKAKTPYRLLFRGNSNYGSSTSTAAVISVQPRLAVSAPDVAKTYTTNKVKGRVRPAVKGTVELQRYHNGAWRTLSKARATSKGRFSLRLEPTDTHKLALRVVRPAGRGLLAATSVTKHVPVVARNLQTGDSGPDVRALQQELRHLHYDVGSVNGNYGYDTFHAVTAFQKVQRLPDDGNVGTKTWKALGSPRTLHLRHPMQGAAIEVNLARQVVIYAVDGKIKRIMDSSTGGGYYYTNSSGGQSKAVTPTGHFHIVYKREGWVTSNLGTLYRPAYFNNDGYAIHGEGEVPPYPASHGCVRITVPAMDRMYNKIPVGMSVWIY